MNKLVFFLYLDHAEQVNQLKHDYSNHVRQQVYQALLMRSKNGKLGKNDTTIVGQQFGVRLEQFSAYGSKVKNNLLKIFQSMFIIEREVEVVVKQSLLTWKN